VYTTCKKSTMYQKSLYIQHLWLYFFYVTMITGYFTLTNLMLIIKINLTTYFQCEVDGVIKHRDLRGQQKKY
jgi:hypothetical protein